MSRLLLAAFALSILAATLAAQSPTPKLPAQTPPGTPPQTASKSSAAPASSPSASPTIEDVVNSLGPADLQTFITLLKSNFVDPDAITDTELNRATVEGLMVRLPRGVMLLPGKDNSPNVAPSTFYSEIIAGHIAYLRLGSLNSANLQALDKSLSAFPAKKVNAVIVDLRASGTASDFGLATEFAKRFCPKGKSVFSLRKQIGRASCRERVCE